MVNVDTTEFDNYFYAVTDYLEYLGYPYWVEQYVAADVAKSLGGSILIFYRDRLSPRTAALAIFGITFEQQIKRIDPDVVKH